MRLDKQKYRFARASDAFLYFSAVVARLQRETAQFHVLSRTGTKDNNFLFVSWILMQSFRIQLQKKFSNIRRIKRDGISAIKFEAAQIHFSSDVFVVVAVVVA